MNFDKDKPWSRRDCMTALASIGMGLHPTLVSADDPPPLSPQNGGQSISADVLEKGDLVLSTTSSATVSWVSAAVSAALRAATGGGPVSHSSMATGDGSLIDARPSNGVSINPVADSLSDASVAVAFRFPNITTTQQQQIVDFAFQQLGKAYDYAGAVSTARYFFGQLAHVLVDLGASNNKFFCSKLVLDSYGGAGVSLTTSNPNWPSPNDLVELSWFGDLQYIGHLKYQPGSH